MLQPFTITPRVIAHLGEDLIKNESIALLELVKNAYDADASHCTVNFTFNQSNKLQSITVEDDGCGMTLETIQKVWLVIGTDHKKKIISEGFNNGRMPLGEKGIGRLGVHKLGRKIKLFTKSSTGSEVSLSIDWNNLEQSKSVEDFQIEIETHDIPQKFTSNGQGTKIFIESLKSEWDRRTLRTVHRDLTSLNSPFSNNSDSFEVLINSNNSVFQGLPNVYDILSVGMYKAHCSISGNRLIDFHYEFTPWQSLTKIDGRVIECLPEEDTFLIRKVEEYLENGRRKITEEPFSIGDYKIGQIDVDLVIFEKDVSVFSYVNTEKRSLNEYLRENGGVRVYRDGVRVYNYGERDNDWLGLDSRRAWRAGGVIGNNQIIGSVSLNRATSSDLKEKTNREGFIEDDAYYAFVDAVKYAIDCVVQLRNQDKFNLVSIYKPSSKVSEPVVGPLNEVIDIVNHTIADEEDKTKIKNYLYRIEQQYRDVRDTLIKSANAGLNLGTAVHEMEKNVARLKGLAERGEIEKIKELAEQLERIVAGYSVFLMNSDIRVNDVAQIAKLVIENNMFRFKDHRIKVFSNYKSFTQKANLSKSEAIASLTNLIDNAIYWVSKSRNDDRMIYVYLTDQIKGFASIVVCDNGPGFKLSPEMAIQPFVTGKPMNTGMGLGLHITNEVMTAMKGKLLIMDSYDLQLPEKIQEYTSAPTVVALCFPMVEE